MRTFDPEIRHPEGKPAQAPATAKKAYQRPAFCHERIFETMALQCGKMGGTQGQCMSALKSS